METVEVFTIGGGDYIVNTLNAVAAWTGQGGYKSMIQVVMVMAFGMILTTVAFTGDWRAWFRWFVQATAMYLVLMVPRLDVHVTDRLNPSLQAAQVANVPLGLAAIASFTSQLGDYLVRSSEVVFGLPNDLNYSANGMIYGSRLMEETQGMRITDPVFASNMDAYLQNCTFYDLMLGHKSLNTLKASQDLWSDLGPGSQARSMPYITDNRNGTTTSTIVTCRTGYTNMSVQWNGLIDQLGTVAGRTLYPGQTNALAKAKLYSDLPIAYNYLTGVSKSASDILKQTLVMNAMQQSMESGAATGSSGGSTVDTYARTRADIQTQNTYSAIADNAMKWVPLLNIVLTVVFYALFPVLFPLFLMPSTGVQALKGYLTGFFYLSAWGPLYVILHMITMLKAAADTKGAALDAGYTLATFNGMHQVNLDIATLAGYLVASIPFIAAGMAKGAMAISSNATSFLAPSQQAAEEGAREASTGNVAIGNTSLDNFSFNTRQGNGWNMAAAYTSGAPVFNQRTESGSLVSSFADGTSSVDTPLSHLPIAPQLSQGVEAQLSTVASDFRAKGSHASEQARESTTAAMNDFSTWEHRVQKGTSETTGYGTNEMAAIREGFSARDSLAQHFQTRFGLSKQQALQYASEWSFGGSITGGASAKLGVGTDTAGAGISGGGDLRGGWAGRRTNSNTNQGSVEAGALNEAAASFSRDHGFDRTTDAFRKAMHDSTNSDVRSLANGVTSNFTKSRDFSREASRYEDAGHRLETSSSLRDHDGLSIATSLQDPFRNFARSEIERTPTAFPAGTRFDPDKREDYYTNDPVIAGQRQLLIRKFSERYAASIKSKVEGSFHTPGFELHRPDIAPPAADPVGHTSTAASRESANSPVRQSLTATVDQVFNTVSGRQGAAGSEIEGVVRLGRSTASAVKEEARNRTK